MSVWTGDDYSSTQAPAMLLLFVVCIPLVAVLVAGMTPWERAMRIPGHGG